MIQQKVIPAISSFKNLEKFLRLNLEYCVILNFHINHLPMVITQLKKADRKCIVHSGMIKGLSSDNAAVEYLIQTLKVDGIIATKPSVIQVAKRNNVLSIFRMFLIDSTSFEKGVSSFETCQPDMVELLPAISYQLLNTVKERITAPIIGGGMITSKEMIDDCINGGMISVTTSEPSYWGK